MRFFKVQKKMYGCILIYATAPSGGQKETSISLKLYIYIYMRNYIIVSATKITSSTKVPLLNPQLLSAVILSTIYRL